MRPPTELRRDLARLDLVNQTMAADDDIEVFDHFPRAARPPTRRPRGGVRPTPRRADRSVRRGHSLGYGVVDRRTVGLAITAERRWQTARWCLA